MENGCNYAKKLLLILLCTLLAGLMWGCNSSKKEKANPPAAAELGIYAFGTTDIDPSDRGHSFLTLKNTSNMTLDFLNYPLEPYEEITISYWPDSTIRINYDALEDMRSQDSSHDVAWMRKNLTESEVATLIALTKEQASTTYKNLTNNCTTYAVGAWNTVNDEKPLKDDNWFSIDAPKWTKEYIEKNYEDMTVSPYKPCSKLDKFDLFFTKSDGALVPYHIALTNVSASVDEENAPYDIDISWEKWGKEMYDGTILINKVRVIYQEKGSGMYNYTDMQVDADKGGCILGNLEKNTTYLILLCPLYEYEEIASDGTIEKKTVEGEWATLEAKTGGPLPEITFTYDFLGTEIGTVTATDPETNELVWTYSAPGGPASQLAHSAEVGLFDSHYYIQEDYDLVCFDAYTGEILWRQENSVERGPVSTFDENGNIYLSFFLNDLIIEFSPEGKILHTLHTSELGYQDTFWPYEMKVEDGYLAIHYAGNTYEGNGGEHWAYINLDTWFFDNGQ